MFHRVRENRVARTLPLTLLMVVGAAAATVESRVDSRLVEAARNQDVKTVRALVSQHADVNARSDDGSTALLWAAHWNDLETANLLLARGRGRERRERLSDDAACRRRAPTEAPRSCGCC